MLMNGSYKIKQANSASKSKYTYPDVGTTKYALKDVGGRVKYRKSKGSWGGSRIRYTLTCNAGVYNGQSHLFHYGAEKSNNYNNDASIQAKVYTLCLLWVPIIIINLIDKLSEQTCISFSISKCV